MNIFVLDKDPKIAAQYHCNKHNVKMILESAQILSTVIREQFPDADVYKSTHKNHPCTLWTKQSIQNFKWLYQLAIELCVEYTYRYEKTHKTEQVLSKINQYIDKLLFPENTLTPFAQAMPSKYKNKNPVIAYRNYYIFEKSNILQYKKRSIPKWIKELEI